MQSRRQSLLETCSNTGIGVIGSWFITMGCLHWIPDKVAAATAATLLCTVWSVVRGYGVRRYFNARAA